MEGTTLTIDLERLGYGGEDGMTLGDAVVAEAARQVVREGTLAREVRERITRIADAEIRTALAPLIDKALTEALQPTNAFGESKGAPTTLREVIVERTTKYLREPDPEARGTPRPSRIESFISKEVRKAVEEDLRDAMKQAREQIVASVKDKAAEVIAETIAKTVVR